MDINQSSNDRVIYVWDRACSISGLVEHLNHLLFGKQILAVHALPHESIYSYGDLNCLSKDKPRAAEKLEREFRKQVATVSSLEQCGFEIVFGDRIQEITSLAKRLQVEMIVMPRFKQSSFSIWMHGDLNKKVEGKSPCQIHFLEPHQISRATESPPRITSLSRQRY